MGFAGWKLAKPLSRSNAYVLKDITGQYINSAKPTFRLKNIDVDLNLEFANKLARGLKLLGNISAVGSVFMTSIEIANGQKNLIGEGGFDLVMTGIGVMPGYAWAISSVYFLGKGALKSHGYLK